MRDKILQAPDRATKTMDIPEWGCTVTLKELSVGERLQLWDVLSDDANKDKTLYVFAIIFTLVDEAGNRLFQPEDYDAIACKNADVVLKLGRECALFNRLLSGAIDDAKKN